jgi:hypothetical protein
MKDESEMTQAEFEAYEQQVMEDLETPKTAEVVDAKHEELIDRVWYQRHLRHGYSEEAAKRVRAKYADRTMYGEPMLEWDAKNLGRIEGWMAALRWAAGGFHEEEDSAGLYDT